MRERGKIPQKKDSTIAWQQEENNIEEVEVWRLYKHSLLSLPLPGQETNTTTFPHLLQGSLRLLHLIIDGVQTLLDMVQLLCRN